MTISSESIKQTTEHNNSRTSGNRDKHEKYITVQTFLSYYTAQRLEQIYQNGF